MQKALDTVNPWSKEIAPIIAKSADIFFVGLGLGEQVAQEGSLKMKELTYLHCQCFSFANISNNFFPYVRRHPGVPTIFIVLESDNMEDK